MHVADFMGITWPFRVKVTEIVEPWYNQGPGKRVETGSSSGTKRESSSQGSK